MGLLILCLVVPALILASSIGSAFAQDDKDCPLACPEGWDRWGFSEHCYKLPAQPAKLDTFWNHDKRCKEMEPTSYVAVMNDLAEQAVGSAIALQYAVNWLAVMTNGFMWLGGYTTPSGWKFLDGTDQNGNILMTAADLIGSQKNGTCLGADAKTLGLWQTRPCDDKTGAAICEMPRRHVCGKTGGILPITPISLSPCSLANLFPKLPSIPYIGTLLADSALDKGLSSIGSTLSSWLGGDSDKECSGSGATPKSGCPSGCPAGWFAPSNAPDAHCYKSVVAAQMDSFWNMQEKCKKAHPNSYISVINTFLELSMDMGSVNNLIETDPAFAKIENLWLGSYATSTSWKFFDGTDGGLLMAMANLPRPPQNGTCLIADWKTLGNWRAVPCSSPIGSAFCEMPKLTACSGLDGPLVTSLTLVDLTPEKVQQMFPNSPPLPGLGQVLGTEKSQGVFDPLQAEKNEQSGQKLGDAISSVMCAKQSSGGGSGGSSGGFFGTPSVASNKPDWQWLTIGGDQVNVPGRWGTCKSNDAFLVQASSYLNVWSRCRNQGYEVAMPANSFFSGWYPFQVGTRLAEYYRQETGGFGLVATGYTKVPLSAEGYCGGSLRYMNAGEDR